MGGELEAVSTRAQGSGDHERVGELPHEERQALGAIMDHADQGGRRAVTQHLGQDLGRRLRGERCEEQFLQPTRAP